MKIPSRRFCDLCKNEIDTSRVWPQLCYPLDRAEVERFVDEIRSHAPAWAGTLNIGHVPVPQMYAFDLCGGCVDGLLPMLAELKTRFIQEHFRKRQERAAGVAREEE